MAVKIGSARSDERGNIAGGAAGDQTGNEVGTQNWYLHKKGWVVIRAKNASAREKIAVAMERACANNNIGYDQSNRYGLYNAVKSKGYDPSKCTVKTETDCSATVRVCCCYAGIIVGDFNTSSELLVLKSSGKFDVFTDSKICGSSDYLLRGDILVTKTKGHTVVVLSNGSKASSSSNTTTNSKVAQPILKNGSKGAEVKKLQNNLNTLGYKGSNKKSLAVDGTFGPNVLYALKAFQNAYKLSVDGVYGPASYNKMASLIK